MFEARQRTIQQAKAWDKAQKPGQGGPGAVLAAKPRPGPKKPVMIEDLLRWTYREELPKDRETLAGTAALGFGHAWGSVAAYGELLAKVDDHSMNRWGVVPDKGAGGDPHPDALVVGNAVIDLEGLVLGLPEDWDPLSGLGDLGDHVPRIMAEALERLTFVAPDGTRQHKLDLRRLVFKHAILGGCPVTETEVPEFKLVKGANGRPKWFIQRDVLQTTVDGQEVMVAMEFDGWSATQHRPLIGAYQKTYLDPDPVDAVVARAEYEIWHAALGVLVNDLSGQMRDHEVLPTPRPARPWEEATPEPERIWPDLTPAPAAPSRKKPRRRGSVSV